MLRRRSMSVQPPSPSESVSNRSSSFTLRSTRCGDGDVFCRDAPIFISEASPRRPVRFRIPVVGMIKAGLAGIRRQKQIPLKKQCVWMDTPKGELLDELHKQRAKSTTALRDHPVDRDTNSTDDLDILINDGIFHLPRTGPLQRSMFRLSRVRESERTEDKGETFTVRTNDGTPIKMRSSASSMTAMTPRKPPRSHRGSSAITSPNPFLSEDAEREINKESSSDHVLTFTTIPDAQPDVSRVESPMAIVDRPMTRMDSRLHTGSTSGIVSPDLSALPSDRFEHPQQSLESFRSDQVLFHHSLGYKQLRLDTGLELTGRSDDNVCIGKRPSASGRRSSDLRRVKFHANDIPKEHESEVEDTRQTEELSEAECESESEETSPGDDCSVMEEPRNLSMWLDWLEERSNVTRKEILYRMGCQRAFIQEAQEQLRSHALAAEDLEDVWQPKMKDRLAVLRRCSIERARKSKTATRALGINDDEITDISFDDVRILRSEMDID